MPDNKNINDADRILQGFFGSSSLGLNGSKKAAAEAEKFLNELEKKQKSQSKSTDTQTKTAKTAKPQKTDFNAETAKKLAELEKRQKAYSDNLEKTLSKTDNAKMSASIQSELDALTKNLEADGLADSFKTSEVKAKKPTAVGTDEKKPDVNAVFSSIEKDAANEVIGQDEFIHNLTLAFKRPFVTGKEKDKPANIILVSGKKGTGKHSAVNFVTEKICAEGLLENGSIAKIDLSLYREGGDQKLFIQDLFSAVKSESPVIIFENFDKCSKAVLSSLSEFAQSGKLRLSSRYALQKGMLVDVGTALVPGAVSEISADGQYLVFVTENAPSKLGDSMGAAFLRAVGDTCVTAEFSPQSLNGIGKQKFEELSQKCSEKLNYKLQAESEIFVLFASKFTRESGVNSIENFSDKCFKVLSEHKLRENADALTFDAVIKDKHLVFKSGDSELAVEENRTDEAVLAVKRDMDDIIGLDFVKEYIYSLEEHFKVNLLRKERGLKTAPTSMHMIFTGNPGTGKTTVARLVSRYLKAIGVLTGGQLVEVTRADLVGRYVGHTAPLTRSVIESAVGGVLFIDEAYSLYRGNDDSFGLEAIDTLVKGMEDMRENLIVILAGYTDEMNEFLTANSGLKSRFPNIIEFPDYTAEELLAIAKLTVKNKGYTLNSDCDKPLLDYFERKQKENARENGNGRMARNLIEAAVLNQSKRIIAEKSDNLEELILSDFDFDGE